MYEVFINHRSLIISNDVSNFEKNIFSYNNFFSWSKIINLLLQGQLDYCFVQVDNLCLAWQSFKDEFEVIEAAGGVVMKNEKMLFIFRNNKWDLPKGKLEKEETIDFCALREVQEECGILDLEILSSLNKTYHTYKKDGKLILKVTHWFLMKSTCCLKLIPQREEGIEKVEWKNVKSIKLALRNTYPNIVRVVTDAEIKFSLFQEEND